MFLSRQSYILWGIVLLLHQTLSQKVVTLGDSYAAGTGIHTVQENYDDAICWSEFDTTPGGKFAASQGIEHVMKACAGHTIDQTVAQWDDVKMLYAEEADQNWENSLLIISTGGNSLRSIAGDGFGEFVSICLTQKRCDRQSDNEIQNFPEVQEELEAFYQNLAAEASNATIRVMGYPKVFNSSPFRCFVPGINVAEANNFDENGAFLNEVVRAVVEQVKSDHPDLDIEFIDLREYYTNGACHLFHSTRQIRSLSLRSIVPSFHPTQLGYDLSYAALLESIGASSFNRW